MTHWTIGSGAYSLSLVFVVLSYSFVLYTGHVNKLLTYILTYLYMCRINGLGLTKQIVITQMLTISMCVLKKSSIVHFFQFNVNLIYIYVVLCCYLGTLFYWGCSCLFHLHCHGTLNASWSRYMIYLSLFSDTSFQTWDNVSIVKYFINHRYLAECCISIL